MRDERHGAGGRIETPVTSVTGVAMTASQEVRWAAGHMGPALQGVLQGRARVPCRKGSVADRRRAEGSPPYG